MKRHNKLRIKENKDEGLSKGEWAGIVIMIAFCLLAASFVIAFIIASVKLAIGGK